MLAQIIHFILQPYFWIPLVGILGFLTFRNYRNLNRLKVLNVDSVLLMLEIPRANDKNSPPSNFSLAFTVSFVTRTNSKTLAAYRSTLASKSSRPVVRFASTFGCPKFSKASSRGKFTLNTRPSKFTVWTTIISTIAVNIRSNTPPN